MRHVHAGESDLLVESAKLGAQLNPQKGIEVAQRFIEQEKCRMRCQRAGEGDALLLPSAEFRWVSIAKVPTLHEIEYLVDAAFPQDILLLLRFQRVGNVLVDGHMGPERVVLENHSDVSLVWRQGDATCGIYDDSLTEFDGPEVGTLQADEAPERRFTAAAGAEQDQKFPVLYFEIDVAKYVYIFAAAAERLVEATHTNLVDRIGGGTDDAGSGLLRLD